MVYGSAPGGEIVFAHHASSGVGRGGFDSFHLYARRGTANARNTARTEVGVAIVVVKPAFQRFASGFSAKVLAEVCRFKHAVEHGFVPLVVTRHPAKVVLRRFLIAKQLRGGLSAVSCSRGHAHILHKLVLARVAIS